MSTESLSKLQKLWGKLTFSEVSNVIARDPQDILSIEIRADTGHTDYYIKSKIIADIPVNETNKAVISWRRYFGFTKEGIYFHNANYQGIDYDINLTMDWSQFLNHKSGSWEKPEVGSLICGEISETKQGLSFSRWFHCDKEFELLVDIIRNGTNLTELELGSKLITSGFPDKYWAIARLLLFNNVQAFVDNLKDGDKDQHPAYGQFYGETLFSNNEKLKVLHSGMYLPMNAAKFVHKISENLNSEWWTEFKKLAYEQGLRFSF